MRNTRQPPHDFGMSWGVPGFRVGRSQYGTWWVSVGLPFGIRITRRIGKERRPLEATPQGQESEIPSIDHSREPQGIGQAQPTATHSLSKNQEILERMRSKKD